VIAHLASPSPRKTSRRARTSTACRPAPCRHAARRTRSRPASHAGSPRRPVRGRTPRADRRSTRRSPAVSPAMSPVSLPHSSCCPRLS
jgi:hypothetical protein